MRHNTPVDYLRAAQPRVVALFLLTVVAAMLLCGSPGVLYIVEVAAATALTVGGAAMLNNYLERDLDLRMARTRRRPIAAGRIAPRRALVAGLALLVAGTLGLGLAAGLAAAAFALAGAAYYVLVYTLLLKPRLALSAIPGSLAGVFPALVGWAAMGMPGSADILFLCVLIVVWSPPHSWSLSLALADEYRSSGIPTPAVRYGGPATVRRILAGLALLTALTLIPVVTGTFGAGYLLITVAAGAVLWIFAVRLVRRPTAARAWALFKVSGPYLGTVVLAMLVDRLL